MRNRRLIIPLHTVIIVALLITPALLAGTIEGRVKVHKSVKDLSNFVVWVETVEGDFSPAPVPVVIDQKDLQFIPHVLVIQAGTTVEFPNSDPVSHNVFSISDVKRFNLGLYQRGAVRQVKFEKPGVVELLCNVHLEMSAYIVVVRSPYFAKTKADGTFRIENAPPGKHRLRLWHERLPTKETEVTVPAEGVVKVILETGFGEI